ncbi:MAG: lipoyl synthase [SAR324 cluster bacterium]|nr:lipoyl synthase [SAR324 cluster bacterium]
MTNLVHDQKTISSKPAWLKVGLPRGEKYNWIKDKSGTLQLSTVCQEARCPNIGECWQGGTATFMLMGDICTRGCRFCSVKTSRNPPDLDSNEPQKLADTISQMNLNYVVITSVDRDDLPDQGAEHIATSIRAVKSRNPDLLVEMLIPDFSGISSHIQKVIDAKPDVLAHNLETVDRLTSVVRDPRAGYQQSIDVLLYIKKQNPRLYTKSSLMLGLGEARDEVITAMEQLYHCGVNFLTLGQYLQPNSTKLRVFRFIHPDEFRDLEEIGRKIGFDYVASGPLVRSSYRAAEFFIERKISLKTKAI